MLMTQIVLMTGCKIVISVSCLLLSHFSGIQKQATKGSFVHHFPIKDHLHLIRSVSAKYKSAYLHLA